MIDWEDRTPECRQRLLKHLRGEKDRQRPSLVPAFIAGTMTIAQAGAMIWYFFFAQAIHVSL